LQRLLADYVNHDCFNPLVAIQLDATNAFCSLIERQSQSDVLAGKASRTYYGSRLVVGDTIPSPSFLFKYSGYFQSIQVVASIMRFSDNQDSLAKTCLASLAKYKTCQDL